MLKTRGEPELLAATAHALRPARIVREELRHFTATTFPQGAREGCALYLRRLEAFGMIGVEKDDQWVDVLDVQGDIVHEVPLTKRGFEWLRGQFKFVLED